MSDRHCSYFSSVDKDASYPRRPGPKTEIGKNMASLNSLQHGLRTDKLLMCKYTCFYRDGGCHLYDELYPAGCRDSQECVR